MTVKTRFVCTAYGVEMSVGECYDLRYTARDIKKEGLLRTDHIKCLSCKQAPVIKDRTTALEANEDSNWIKGYSLRRSELGY